MRDDKKREKKKTRHLPLCKSLSNKAQAWSNNHYIIFVKTRIKTNLSSWLCTCGGVVWRSIRPVYVVRGHMVAKMHSERMKVAAASIHHNSNTNLKQTFVLVGKKDYFVYFFCIRMHLTTFILSMHIVLSECNSVHLCMCDWNTEKVWFQEIAWTGHQTTRQNTYCFSSLDHDMKHPTK